eukprot:m51a1_g9172 hypothetical protein (558) ;mRNA; f:33001-35143
MDGIPELPLFSVLDGAGVDALAALVRQHLEKFDLDVSFKLKPKRASAKNSSIDGPGLGDAEVDIPATFDIKARDNTGKPLDHGDTPFEVKITDPDGEEVPANVVDNKDGTYKVDYTPTKPGPHDVKVALDGENVEGSPAKVDVAPPTPDPLQCTAEGPGLEHAVVGEPAPFTITARNRAGMKLKTGGHQFEAQLQGPNGAVPAKIVDNGDGTYAGEYVAVDDGSSHVDLTYEGKHVAKSPYQITVDKAAGKPDASKSYAFGPGVEGGCDTWSPATFTVQSVDPNGDKVTKGGDLFEATVTDASGEELPVELVDNGDGTYSGSYKPTKPEKHTVEVVLRRPTEHLFYEHIQKSPFTVEVAPGLDPSKSIAFGPGLESGQVEDTKPTSFKVQARDVLGHDVKTGGAPLAVAVTAPDGTPVDAHVVDNGDGTYDADYAPAVDGPHTVAVTMDGKPVASSPYTVDVKRGADYMSTTIEQFSFVVVSRGKDGNPLEHGQEKVDVVVEKAGAEGEAASKATVDDKGDGTYLVAYSLPGPGEYALHVSVNGHEIKSSPLTQIIP